MSVRFWRGPVVASATSVASLAAIGLLAALLSVGASPATKLSPSTGCWQVKVDGNDAGDRVVKTGLSGTPEEVQSQLLQTAKHDPSALVALYNMSPLVDEDLLTESDVASGECYTAGGKQAWYAVSAELAKAAKTNEEAPANGCNTYVKDGKVEIHCEDILGDREATKIVWGDGSETWILHRCGNPVTKEHPRHRHHDDDDDDDDDSPPRHRCPNGTVPYQGRCVKPAGETDRDGAGGDESKMKQDVDEHRQDSDDDDEPPPAHRDDSDDDDGDSDGSEEHGSSGDGGAGEAEGPSDESHSDDETTEENEPDAPF